ncbi:MAG: type II toxin-antitoxin system VapC family toxin [Proteobacteria bacterium]|nr:type II toxin-antitoxin system VapC family toxin [Pseudomonadota bacterium]
MIILDSNVLIYAAQPEHGALRQWLGSRTCGVSLASTIEVLGFHKLTAMDKAFFLRAFAILTVFPISHSVAETAIRLRQIRKMSLGDSIIAATALEYQYPLATRNIDDFLWIDGLVALNPLETE